MFQFLDEHVLFCNSLDMQLKVNLMVLSDFSGYCHIGIFGDSPDLINAFLWILGCRFWKISSGISSDVSTIFPRKSTST
ncbi:uncharacterized protein OCT59_012687 [Rhizophagus irregularis]|uniref:uncharacterized protein n=1 Tax=Rhizophagus irregularis TaxID=588596 RepID=UPI00333453C5|nr:hypothetical protein OCT59_012687 [Rhizophagus irregularis]